MDLGFLRLDFDQAIYSYLERITASAPMAFESRPRAYLGDPQRPITYEQATDVGGLGLTTSFKVVKIHTYLGSASSLPEFTVVGEADGVLAHWYPHHVEGFKPYFVWAYNVNRSRHCRRFAVSVSEIVLNDHPVFTGTINWEPLNSEFGQRFNVYAQNEDAAPYSNY